MKLRSYQERAIDELRAQYRAGRRSPVLVLPTGAGKTLVAAAIISGAVARGNEALFLAHRRELVRQCAEKLGAAGVSDVRVILADEDHGNQDAPVTVASIPTLLTPRWAGRLPRARLVVLDECHHSRSRTWQGLAEHYADARLLGLTATPQRGDGRALSTIFDSLVVGATVRELTARGHLVPCRTWSPATPLDPGQLAMPVPMAYARFGAGERAVVFCTDISHAQAVAAELAAGGVPAEAVHGKLGARRDEVLARFRAGALRAVTSVHTLTEGWDDPGCSVCILARGVGHAGTLLQMAGRVLRPADGKARATLIDLCGSVLQHGTPEMDRRMSLDGDGIELADAYAIRQCPTCGSVFPAAAVGAAGTCPECGELLPRQQRRAARAVNVGVDQVTDLAGRRATILRENLVAVARETGRDQAWVERAHAAISARELRWHR